MDESIKNSQKKSLSAKQRKCIELLSGGELAQYEIAHEIDVAQETISRWKKDEVFALALEERLGELDRERRMVYRGMANKAARRLGELMDSHNSSVAMAAVKEVLHLAGDNKEQPAMPEEKQAGVIILPGVPSAEEM